ncbi:hypothetical protein [Nocardia sp. NPDC127526]|uniref:hypothetical protein n=1 Tax=Nocardia sp. NPDC127526 TaxID=3345393 RepID=UPI00362B6BE4
MPKNHPDWIMPAPSELYDRLYEVTERIAELRREMAQIKLDYGRLHQKPEALAVDDLGDPIDPVQVTEEVMWDLQDADRELYSAAATVSRTRGKFATRLKLTDAAAEQRWQQLQQREQRTPIDRTR